MGPGGRRRSPARAPRPPGWMVAGRAGRLAGARGAGGHRGRLAIAAVLGMTPDTTTREEKSATALTKADEAAAKKMTSCRWLDNADGTATDLNSGLQWELKTSDGGVHHVDNRYAWSATIGGTTPNGTLFTEFLSALNGGMSG